MRTFLVGLLLPLFAATSFGQTPAKTDKRLSGVDKELQQVLESCKAAGFAVAVVEKDKVIYEQGFGYRDYEKQLPVTPATVFAIGSCSKAFTASIMGLLQEENKLSLSDNPKKYVPELQFFNEEMNSQVTIKDLMTHRTGLPRHDYAWYFFPTHSKDSLIARIQYQEPTATVRERWQYNNFMYLTQGVIAEKITGKTWEQNVIERFFRPLGMNNSSADIQSLQNHPNAAFGYGLKDLKTIYKKPYYDIAGMSPAGSINSSVSDMSKWAMAWINGGKYKGIEVLPAAYVQEALASQMIMGSELPSKERPEIFGQGYGYGWMTASYKGHYRAEHGGNIDGFSANICIFPSDSISIIVLTNQEGSSVPATVRNIIADRLLNLPKTDWTKEYVDMMKNAEKAPKPEVTSSQKTGTTLSHPLADYAGSFAHPGYGTLKLVIEHDSLFAVLPRQKMWLKHYHYDIFQPFEITNGAIDSEDDSPIRVNFATNETGEIAALHVRFEQALDPLEFTRQTVVVATSAEELTKYVGDYNISGMTAKIFQKSDQLMLFIEGQPEYELLAVGNHTFTIKNLDGFRVQFVPATNGAMEELLFIQPNGTFKAKKK